MIALMRQQVKEYCTIAPEISDTDQTPQVIEPVELGLWDRILSTSTGVVFGALAGAACMAVPGMTGSLGCISVGTGIGSGYISAYEYVLAANAAGVEPDRDELMRLFLGDALVGGLAISLEGSYSGRWFRQHYPKQLVGQQPQLSRLCRPTLLKQDIYLGVGLDTSSILRRIVSY